MPYSSNTNSWYEMSDFAIVNEISGFIRCIRLQKKITQQQSADKVGLYCSTISEMENGRHQVCSVIFETRIEFGSGNTLSTRPIYGWPGTR